MGDGFDAELSSHGSKGRVLVPVVGAFEDHDSVTAEAAAEELAMRHFSFKRQKNVVAAFFLSQIYRSWGLVAHRGWARLMLDHRCFVEVPNATCHRAERAHAEAGHEEPTFG